MNADVKSGNWNRDEFALSRHSLAGATVGLVGYGRIGKSVARRLPAFGCRINVLSRSMPLGLSDANAGPLVTNVSSLEELFAKSNVVSLHVPLTDSTRGIIDRSLLSLLPEGAVIVNTARGGLLRSEDVLDALESGPLAALAVDVMEQSERLVNRKLIEHPRVIVTPHIAAATTDSSIRKVRFTYANMQRAVLGQPLLERIA
jgi:phosphoglycerate dehydrogenase-like enzyme